MKKILLFFTVLGPNLVHADNDLTEVVSRGKEHAVYQAIVQGKSTQHNKLNKAKKASSPFNANAKIGQNGESFLHAMVISRKIRKQTFDQLQTLGVDVNQQDTEGRTPLHYVAATCDYRFAELLLHAGASTDIQDNQNRIAAALIAQCHWPEEEEFLQQLLKHS